MLRRCMLVNVAVGCFPMYDYIAAQEPNQAMERRAEARGLWPFIRTVRPARDLVGQLVEPVRDQRGGRLQQMSHRR